MRLGLLTVVVGLAAGIAMSRLTEVGRLDWRPPPRLQWLPVAAAAGVLAVATRWLGDDAWVAATLVVTAALVAVGTVNHAHPGSRLLTAGVLANGLVVVANAGMPVAASAVTALGGTTQALPASGRHHLLTDASALPWLADTVAVGWLQVVVSPGDALLAAGGAVIVATAFMGAVHHERTRGAVVSLDQADQPVDAPDGA